MTVIIPTIEKYEVCDYTPKVPDQNFHVINKEVLNSALKKRKFTVIETFTDIHEARKFIEGTGYIVRYVFKELPDDNNN
jgi:hypothetical protein|tara:strand:+ start:572 stop:808 length:237 start_codon:yes stop_codon:yes gene_type:complete